MKHEQIPITKMQAHQHFRNDLLGEWYNYEGENSPVSDVELEYWLTRLEKELTLRNRPSKV